MGTGWSCTALGTTQPKADASGPGTGLGEANITCNANLSSPSALLQDGLLATLSLDVILVGTHTLELGSNPATQASTGVNRVGAGVIECEHLGGSGLTCVGATLQAGSCEGCLAGGGDAPPAEGKEPLAQLSNDWFTEMRRDPLVVEKRTGRFEGQVVLLVDRSFDVQALHAVAPKVELLREGKTHSHGLRSLLIRVPDEATDRVVAAVSAWRGVRGASKNWLHWAESVPNDPQWVNQELWGMRDLELPGAWEISTGHPAVRVAVIDTGANPVPDVQSQLDLGWNVIDDDYDTRDDETLDGTIVGGHGTAVASIIAARRNNSLHLAGVAPDVRIVPVKACSLNIYQGGTVCPAFLVQDALLWILDESARAGRFTSST